MDRNCRELVRGGRSHFFALCNGGRSHFGGFWIQSLLGSNQYWSLLVMLNTTKLDFFVAICEICGKAICVMQILSFLILLRACFSEEGIYCPLWVQHFCVTACLNSPICACACVVLVLVLAWTLLYVLVLPFEPEPGYGHGTKITHSNLNHSLQYSTVWIGLSVGNTCWHNPRYHWEQCILLQGTIQAP